MITTLPTDSVQLAVVSLVITGVLSHLFWSLLFGLFMLGVATFTSSRRIDAPAQWRYVGVSIASGVVPTPALIFASAAVPFTGASIVPVVGIIIGGAMTASSLSGRRIFAALHDEHGAFEAGSSLGLPRAAAIDEVIGRHLPEALVPGLDQTRTVGLVTLPGAFTGVLLGGGTPIQAGAAQLLVLVGLLAAARRPGRPTAGLITSRGCATPPGGVAQHREWCRRRVRDAPRSGRRIG